LELQQKAGELHLDDGVGDEKRPPLPSKYKKEQAAGARMTPTTTKSWEFLDDRSFLRDIRHTYDELLYEDEYDDTYDSLEPFGSRDADSADELQDLVISYEEKTNVKDLEDLVSIFSI
jgi:hypothetical protein